MMYNDQNIRPSSETINIENVINENKSLLNDK